MPNKMKEKSAAQTCLSDKVTSQSNLVIVGNMSAGKTTLFNRLCSSKVREVTDPDSNTAYKIGFLDRSTRKIIDTPGSYTLFSINEDEKVARNLILSQVEEHGSCGIIFVADAKNLRRSLGTMLQFMEYGLPMILALNMSDETHARGIQIDCSKLSDLLGIEVCFTVASNRRGIQEFLRRLPHMRAPKTQVKLSSEIGEFIEKVEEILPARFISSRVAGLLLLNEDEGIMTYLSQHFGKNTLQVLMAHAAYYHDHANTPFDTLMFDLYNVKAKELVQEVQTSSPLKQQRLFERFGDWCMHFGTGIPIAFVIVFLMYQFVGSFGATYLVDKINGTFFQGFLIPKVTQMMDTVPSPFIREMIVDPDFGVLPTGVFLALGLVLPVLFCFYIAFGVLEHSGYLPRISILLNQVFQKMGLNGKGVIPLVMGFSCVTMALLTTRLLDTKKEKNIASFLLLLGMPCAPLLAVMLIILDKMPVTATFMVFGTIGVQILVAGYFANKVLPGHQQALIMELPPMRIPNLFSIIKSALKKTWIFMKEAIPVFILASLAVFLFERLGGLAVIERISRPVINGFIGLPDKSVQVFIKTMIRRESGATEIAHLSNVYTNLQLIVNLLVMTFLSPCINASIVLFKERGAKTASIIMGGVFIYAILVGGLINHVCLFFGFTFS